MARAKSRDWKGAWRSSHLIITLWIIKANFTWFSSNSLSQPYWKSSNYWFRIKPNYRSIGWKMNDSNKEFIKVFLPKLNDVNIFSVPSDSEEVRSFVSNSFTTLARLNFNNNWVKWVEASKYLEALKMAANKDIEHFGVFKTRFTAK